MSQMFLKCDKCCLIRERLFRNAEYYLLFAIFQKIWSLENMAVACYGYYCFDVNNCGSTSLESIFLSITKYSFNKKNLNSHLKEVSQNELNR